MNPRRVLAGTPPFLFVILAAFLAVAPAHAGWPGDGIVVRYSGTIQSMAPDESGGAYFAILDGVNLVVQHVTADGDLPLGPAGFTAGSAYSVGEIVSDGAGGVFVPFILGPGIHVMHVAVDPAPGVSWTTDAATNVPYVCCLHCGSDGAGGVLVAWSDKRTVDPPENTEYKVFAQRIDGAGNALWQSNGVLVKQSWDYDPRGGLHYESVYAQGVVRRGPGESTIFFSFDTLGLPGMGSVRLDASGAGVGGQTDLAWAWRGGNAVPDGAGGAYIAEGGELDHFTSSGRDWWKKNSGYGRGFTAPDGSGGGLLVWGNGSISGETVYCQRYQSGGFTLYTPGGTPVVTATSLIDSGGPDPAGFAVAPDYSGGAFVAWSDPRSGNRDIYFQHLNGTGSALLSANGVPVHISVADDTAPRLVSFPDGHAIVSWNGEYAWAERINADGTTAVAITTFTARVDAGGVRLAAAFRSDLSVEGVHVYRGEGDGAMTLLDTAVPSAAGSFEYVDAGVEGGQSYRYQIGVVDADGEFLSPVEAVSIPRPQAALEQNRPNPFNPTTVIAVTLPSRIHATLAIYDATGKRVRVLADAVLGPGREEFTWNGHDDRGTPMASGVYFYRVRAGTFTATRRMVLLK